MKNTETDSQPFLEQSRALKSLRNRIKNAKTTVEKISILDECQYVQIFFKESPDLEQSYSTLDPDLQLIFKIILAIGQSHVFRGLVKSKESFEKLQKLLEDLQQVESFYQVIGGIVGYHLTVMELIFENENPISISNQRLAYLKPNGFDISKDTLDVRKAIRAGIENLPKLVEICPIGGAGDRLNLIDEKTEAPLPVAELSFLGRTLLEGLIRDVQAKEYLYYKLMQRQMIIPMALMTSHEKDNHRHVHKICTKDAWFGRPVDSHYLFVQPLVPMVTKNGHWVVIESLQVLLKPGGHGVIWKLVKDLGILDHLISEGYQKALLRQINNPIAGLDSGILAFIGLGFLKDKAFGFESCLRPLKVVEGMDVLIEHQTDESYEYCISNVEYTDFVKKGIQEKSLEKNSPYSAYPSNTNILFADLQVAKEAIERCPIPGMMINMKSKVSCLGEKEIEAGRLESLMQNLADAIVDKFPNKMGEISADQLMTYIAYNDRQKTIGVTKNAYKPGESLQGTPEGCYYQLLENYADLLVNYCHIQIPEMVSEEEYLSKGPSFIFQFHPALGPMWSIIGQKIHGGRLNKGAQLVLEITELEMVDLELEGSLHIIAFDALGKKDSNGVIQYGNNTGKCTLENVQVKNKGVKRVVGNRYWKNEMAYHELMSIELEGNAEFVAENVLFEGNLKLQVPDGHRMTAVNENGILGYRLEKISSPTWFWQYQFDEEERIVLT